MTSSRSKTSRSSSVLALVLAVVGWGLFAPAIAEAGRKRVVILELEGPKAEKFHDDVVKLVKKTHTVVPVDKWNSIAEDLGATRLNDKDVKKVAKKLKIDAVVFGKVDKRRDEYIISLQIRSGRSGQVVGNKIGTKAEGPRLDASASGDLKDELVDAISEMKASGGGDDEEEDEEEEKPAKKASKKDDEDDEEEEEEEEKPAKKTAKKDDEEDEEEKPVKKGFSRKSKDDEDDDEEDPKPAKKTSKKKDDEEEENPLPKAKKAAAKSDEEAEEEEEDEDEDGGKKRKKVASSEDEDEDEAGGDSVEADADVEELDEEEQLTLKERAIDAVLGLSFNMRRMAFSFDSDLESKPPPYQGVPVAGIYIDGTVFPAAIGHKRRDMLKNFGLTVMYDRVIKIESKAMGQALPTTQARYALGVAFRYPIGENAVIGARLRYGRQNFTIGTVDGVGADIPNVYYTIIDPAVTVAVVAAPKITVDAKLGFMAITNTGQIQKSDQYGAATVKGFEGEAGLSYLLTRNIFARGAFRFETIGFAFSGSGMLSTGRDADPEQDVKGARDSYYGGTVAIGVLY
ncbi:MAG: hypothetical protein SFX73_06410 [Kofleriaceae bacterium]|nr:hypothetical protein [Kofleriaceae bacterium]